MMFIIIQDTLCVAGRLTANENHTLWFLIFVKSAGVMSLTVKVLTLTTTCECTFSLYYKILIQGGKTHPLIFIVGKNNFTEYLQSYQILIFI